MWGDVGRDLWIACRLSLLEKAAAWLWATLYTYCCLFLPVPRDWCSLGADVVLLGHIKRTCPSKSSITGEGRKESNHVALNVRFRNKSAFLFPW